MAKVQLVVVDLGYKDGRHSLIECGTVHVNGGSHGQHEANDAPVNVIVLQEALEGDRQRGRTREKGGERARNLLENDLLERRNAHR